MKNGKKALFGIVAVLVLSTCNNYFHDLIPPDDDRILSFEVEGQVEAAVINDNTVIATVARGSPIHNLIPRIRVAREATVLPVTLDYVSAAFPSANLTDAAMKMSTAPDLVACVTDMLKENPDFNVPAMDIPIDFTGPVTMVVVSGRGSVRQYTINVIEDNGEPKLLNLRFSKYDNPELVIDATCVFVDNYILGRALYPADMKADLSFELIPTFEILGEKLEIGGSWSGTDKLEITSGKTPIQFSKSYDYGYNNKTLTVTRDGLTKDYPLIVIFSEDPDSIRSITDFRFTTEKNPNINATAVGSIINNGDTGLITVQVFYSGVQPSTLIPNFISPCKVTVGSAVQTSGSGPRNFSVNPPWEYKVVSKNGLYTRTYTVKVEFVNVENIMPSITAFCLSAALNPELVQDAEGNISHGSSLEDAGLILIDAHYSGKTAPTSLMPEFTAEYGMVSVANSVQVSGASGQNFTRQIKYTVTNPVYTGLKKDYWVQCRMVRDTSGDATITAFSFNPAENSVLTEEIGSVIDQAASKITVYAPAGSNITERTMYPRFTAEGKVSVGEAIQVSGKSGQVFNAPLTYTVVSPNGLNTRSYTVTVRELQSVIYVDCNNNYGYNDGTSWEDAFTNLKDACDVAAAMPESFPKEIWIAKGTYTTGGTEDDYFPLASNTSYIGGFRGNESRKDRRNITANPVIISGNLGAGKYSYHLFAPAFFEEREQTYDEEWEYNGQIFRDIFISRVYEPAKVQGNISFDGLAFSAVRAVASEGWKGSTAASGNYKNGAAIHAIMDSGVISITDCTFNDLKANYGGGIYLYGSGNMEISNSAFSNLEGGAVYASTGKGTFKVTGTTIKNCHEREGFYLSGSGEAEFTNVTFENNKAPNVHGVAIVSYGYNVVLNDTVIKNCEAHCGMVYMSSGNLTMNGGEISNNKIANVIGGIVIINRTFTMNSGIISNNTSTDGYYGGGVSVHGTGTFFMNGGTISGNTTKNGGGVSAERATSFTMNGGTISGNTAGEKGGGVHINGGTFTMKGGTISGNTAGTSGGGVFVFEEQVSSSVNGVTVSTMRGGAFTMIDGTITGNIARENGGGVFIAGSGTFVKTGGTVTGYDKTIEPNGNVVKKVSLSLIDIFAGTNGVINNCGHAVYVNSSPVKRRESTAVPNIGLSFNYNDGTAIISGAWEY